MPADRIIHSSRKTIAIEIRPDGQVWVRAPMHTPQAYIDLFLAEKSDWIQQKLQLIQQRRQPAGEDNSIPEQGLYYLGELFPLQPAPRARSAQIHGQSILVPTGTPAEIKTHFLRFYRREAQKILPPIVHLLAARHAFNPQKVRISSAHARWGSCSSKGTISLTWRLMMVPMPLIEYVILHELTHLKVRNHSKQFWNALQAILPDFAGRRRQLRVMEKQLNFL